MSAKVVFKKQSDGAYYVYKGGVLFGMVSGLDEDEKVKFGKKYRLWKYDASAEGFYGYSPLWFAKDLKDAKVCFGILAEGE